jgi:glycine/serine hydroxymethyltransferase
METIAECIARALEAAGDAAVEASVLRTVSELCAAFPLVA